MPTASFKFICCRGFRRWRGFFSAQIGVIYGFERGCIFVPLRDGPRAKTDSRDFPARPAQSAVIHADKLTKNRTDAKPQPRQFPERFRQLSGKQRQLPQRFG